MSVTDMQKKRGRGRPPKPGGLAEMRADFDKVLSQTEPEVLQRGRDIFGDGSTNDMIGNAVQLAAETLSRDRGQMLKQARPARSRKAPDAERARILARAERLAALPMLITERPGKSASDVARILQAKGFFSDVAHRTLREDIAKLKKLAGPVN